MISKEKNAELIKEFGTSEKDSGNTAVQIALVTAEIKVLTDHLIANKHDYQAKRALNIDVAKRAALVRYLGRKDPAKLAEIKTKLGLK